MSGSGVGKPTGTFQCAACAELWDGSELFDDPLRTAVTWTCGYLPCGALVYKVSNDPKDVYMLTGKTPTERAAKVKEHTHDD